MAFSCEGMEMKRVRAQVHHPKVRITHFFAIFLQIFEFLEIFFGKVSPDEISPSVAFSILSASFRLNMKLARSRAFFGI